MLRLSERDVELIRRALHSSLLRAETVDERNEYQAVLDRIFGLPIKVKDGFLYDFDDDTRS
ncbi:hypothetical protein [Sulfoacidibacillus thermotolerans]|uniref:hypothetical protein n=1 Tax=Sulfoacidibacillus thermotolerans TaxID=1765684 RepID=UPI0011B1DEFC|nr:hypothetical protein [Sulfoacidibacillus thermotolerans]